MTPSMPQSTPVHSSSPHILIVEDDPAIATSLSDFQTRRLASDWLDNATSVLPTLTDFNEQQQPLAGIVLDVGLPDGDGLNLCQDIRRSEQIVA
ncbi:response regulator [Psychrobacter sp. FDAARGOS_221]|uniref:response regulator n=1 Tax=Psychrobacter sp. FDAARGOS_221 TaxID=1975705 RepID=UPI001D0D353A|nr:response regulator [Psychrobacter sp. FDAARGOS_221]